METSQDDEVGSLSCRVEVACERARSGTAQASMTGEATSSAVGASERLGVDGRGRDEGAKVLATCGILRSDSEGRKGRDPGAELREAVEVSSAAVSRSTKRDNAQEGGIRVLNGTALAVKTGSVDHLSESDVGVRWRSPRLTLLHAKDRVVI